MDRWSGRVGRVREAKRREEKKKEDQRRERVRKKEYQSARKGRKVAKHCVFSMFWGSGGSNSRLAKAAGAEPSGRMIDQTYSKIAAYFQIKMRKTPQVRRTFGRWDVEKVHAAVARSTFRSQNVWNASRPENVWGRVMNTMSTLRE